MAFQSKSGKAFSNRPMAIAQDKRDEVSATAGMNKTANKLPDTDPEMGHESEDPSEVVANHGPAEKVMITHTEGKHTVKSKHSDGHSHTSEHASKSEAHEAGKQLAGADDEGQDEMGDDESSNPMAAMGM
jgi:hypothetical protein